MLNTAVTNVPKFSSSGRGWAPLPFTNCHQCCFSWESRLPWWKVLPGSSQVLLHLCTEREAQGCPAAPVLSVCTVLREHTLPVPPAGQQALLTSQHVSGTQEGQGVTAGSWAWLRFLKGECRTTPRQRSLQGLSNSVCDNRQSTWSHWAIRPWYTVATAGGENFA